MANGPAGSSYAGNDTVLGFWRALLGQNVIELDDLDAVCETIALTVGLGEDAIDVEQGLDDLRELGSRAGGTVSKALARVGADRRRTARSAVPTGLGTDCDIVRL